MRRTKENKKLRSILILDLGSEGKRVFTQKNPRVKILAIIFSEFWTLLNAAFNKPPTTTFERYKLLNRKQKDRESYEQFWGALTDLASTCNIKESDEAEWIRDIFICNMKNTDTQRKLLSGTISPLDALNQALIDEKGYFNHQKVTNMSRSSTKWTTLKHFNNHNQIKKKPSLNIERSNSCMKCGNAFTKGHLNVCPAKDITCKNCNYKGHFAKLCKSRNKRPTVNTVSDNYVNTENCTYAPPENSWAEDQESCDVINAWNEYGRVTMTIFFGVECENYLRQKRSRNKETTELRHRLGYDCKYEHTSSFSKPRKFFKTSIKLALDSKLLNDQIFKNKYQMPNIHELIDNVALQISKKSNGRVGLVI